MYTCSHSYTNIHCKKGFYGILLIQTFRWEFPHSLPPASHGIHQGMLHSNRRCQAMPTEFGVFTLGSFANLDVGPSTPVRSRHGVGTMAHAHVGHAASSYAVYEGQVALEDPTASNWLSDPTPAVKSCRLSNDP